MPRELDDDLELRPTLRLPARRFPVWAVVLLSVGGTLAAVAGVWLFWGPSEGEIRDAHAEYMKMKVVENVYASMIEQEEQEKMVAQIQKREPRPPSENKEFFRDSAERHRVKRDVLERKYARYWVERGLPVR